MSDVLADILQRLQPVERLGIMELVRQAGVDVSPWAVKKSGEPVLSPQANPQYCYEWAFGGKGEPFVLCIWHEGLTIQNERIVFSGNYRELCIDLERIAQDRTYEADVRTRSKSQAQRAYAFDFTLQNAHRLSAPVRVVLVRGQRRDDSALGQASSKVEFRMLDDKPWWAHEYSDGNVLLVRGETPPSASTSVSEDPPAIPHYVDQFDLVPALRGEASTLGGFIRSPEVRRVVLDRAQGRCELCGQLGFETRAGSLYLETHHIIPVSEEGPDHPSNVVALCALDHRRAHYAVEAVTLRSELTALMAVLNKRVIR